VERHHKVAEFLLDIESRPGHPKTTHLNITDSGLTFPGDVTFAWTEIDRVTYTAVDRYLNGGYMGTTFTIGAGSPTKKATFTINSGLTGALRSKVDEDARNRDYNRWISAVNIVEDRVCARLISEAVATVHRGGTAEVAGLKIDRQGVRKDGLFGKSLTWPEYAGTEVKAGYLMLLARDGSKVKMRLQVPRGAWNAVLLPQLLNACRSA
jgi:hypothetical protein